MSSELFEETLRELDRDLAPASASAVQELVLDYLHSTIRGEGPVTTGRSAKELVARFEEPMPQAGKTLAQVLERLRSEVLPDVTRLTHPMYMGHQVSAPLPAAIWTEALISALNQSTAVREMAPTVNALEHQLIRWFAELARLGPRAAGTLTSGGTEATFTALLAARAAILPGAWSHGLSGRLPVVIRGEHAHYSVSRAVGALGLGTDQVRTLPSRDFAMDVDALEATLTRLERDDIQTLAVVATAGSTPTGSFDDLTRIGPLCRGRNIWLHVDGAHGASALLSPAHRHRLHGVEHARSLSWDPHKTMLMPLPAGMLLVREGRELDAAFTQSAPYLFHRSPEATDGPSWDLGTRSFQCSRRADALKVWVAIQRYGAAALGALYEHLCTNAVALHARLSSSSDFEALHRPESNILCFRLRLPDLDGAAQDAFHERLRTRFHNAGHGYLTMTTLGGRRVLRVSLMNPRTSAEHLDTLLAGLRAEAKSLHGSYPGAPQ